MSENQTRPSEVHRVFLDAEAPCGSRNLMQGEIRGAGVTYHGIAPRESMLFPPDEGFVRVLFLCRGQATFASPERVTALSERGVYVASPAQPLQVATVDGARVLEFRRYVGKEEMDAVRSGAILPYWTSYADAPTYAEDCKSAKTVSRMLIPARIVPRFAMGSVEAAGEDLVGRHAHPMLEQFFFGLSDNHCAALIDGSEVPFPPDTLLHIPLGSSHGVRAAKGQTIHYLWMDFLFDDAGLAYMDSAHQLQETGPCAKRT